ncbi:helix-turn-helix domain-containing protein [Caballeronia mineralivorans]|jgi:putative transposase|uniref:helix-turn-helix domain-containing protein n=1 Tax=Caballeronia mineralivorans TaxID=2010198 RepID=UPI0023F12700|nr:helix-turn-helix domain-containing protein [Caballeronia mineralivorans]MDB5782939.1 transposase [Caballeronia mineralivorans]
MMAQPSSLQSGVRFRALPTQEQTHVLGQWIGCQRFIYNGKIDEDRLFAAQRRMALRDGALECPTPLDQQYAQFKRSSRRLS